MDISVSSTSYQVENREWLSSNFGCDEPRTITLDTSGWSADHYPNGFIPSGAVVGKLTATGLYVPYDNAASDGQQVAVGILFSAVKVPANGTTDIAAAMLEMGLIVEAKLPYGAGGGQINETGAIDSAGKTDLAGWFKFL